MPVITWDQTVLGSIKATIEVGQKSKTTEDDSLPEDIKNASTTAIARPMHPGIRNHRKR